MPTFVSVFRNGDNSFSSNYVNYNCESFVNELAQASGTYVQVYDVNSNFMDLHQKSLRSGKNSIELIKTPLSALPKLEAVLISDLEVMKAEKIDEYNFIVILE